MRYILGNERKLLPLTTTWQMEHWNTCPLQCQHCGPRASLWQLWHSLLNSAKFKLEFFNTNWIKCSWLRRINYKNRSMWTWPHLANKYETSVWKTKQNKKNLVGKNTSNISNLKLFLHFYHSDLAISIHLGLISMHICQIWRFYDQTCGQETCPQMRSKSTTICLFRIIF